MRGVQAAIVFHCVSYHQLWSQQPTWTLVPRGTTCTEALVTLWPSHRCLWTDRLLSKGLTQRIEREGVENARRVFSTVAGFWFDTWLAVQAVSLLPNTYPKLWSIKSSTCYHSRCSSQPPSEHHGSAPSSPALPAIYSDQRL